MLGRLNVRLRNCKKLYTIRLKFSNFYLISKLQIGIKMN